MNRREMIKVFGKIGILVSPFCAKLVHAATKKDLNASGHSDFSGPSFVLIYDSLSSASLDYRKLLGAANPHLLSRDSDWQSKLAIWDVQVHKKEIHAFVQKFGRNTTSVNYPILISVPASTDMEIEVETWTSDWLNYKAIVDACYPISGGWWSVEGDWNPTTAKVRDHIYRSPNHTGGRFELPWLKLLKFEELQSLHSDHHREMINEGQVYWTNVNKECHSHTR